NVGQRQQVTALRPGHLAGDVGRPIATAWRSYRAPPDQDRTERYCKQDEHRQAQATEKRNDCGETEQDEQASGKTPDQVRRGKAVPQGKSAPGRRNSDG